MGKRSMEISHPSNPAVIPIQALPRATIVIQECNEMSSRSNEQCRIFCQNCHGDLLAVGGVYSARTPWIDEPKCQSCHAGDALDHAGTGYNCISLMILLTCSHAQSGNEQAICRGRWKTLPRQPRPWGMACEACHGSMAMRNGRWPIPTLTTMWRPINSRGMRPDHRMQHLPCRRARTYGQRPHGLHNVNSQDWNLNHKFSMNWTWPVARLAMG